MNKKFVCGILVICFCLMHSTTVLFALEAHDPSGFWKGAGVTLSFSIECNDLYSGKPLREITIQIQEDEYRAANQGISVKLQDGKYILRFEVATLSGQSYVNLPSLEKYRTFGNEKQLMIFRFSAKGFYDQFILVPKNKVVIGKDYPIRVKLVPLSKPWERGVVLTQAKSEYPEEYHQAIDETVAYFVKGEDKPSDWILWINDLEENSRIRLNMFHNSGIAVVEESMRKIEPLPGNPSGRDGWCYYDLKKNTMIDCGLWK